MTICSSDCWISKILIFNTSFNSECKFVGLTTQPHIRMCWILCQRTSLHLENRWSWQTWVNIEMKHHIHVNRSLYDSNGQIAYKLTKTFLTKELEFTIHLTKERTEVLSAIHPSYNFSFFLRQWRRLALYLQKDRVKQVITFSFIDKNTWWYCQSSDESIEGWVYFVSASWKASSWFSRFCGPPNETNWSSIRF